MLKVGDKVKVKEGLEVNKHYGGVRFSDNMENIKEGTIERVEDFGSFRENSLIFRENSLIAYTMLENGYYWSEEMLEKIGDDSMKELTFKEVIANIKEGEVWEVVKEQYGIRKVWMLHGDLRIENNTDKAITCIDGNGKFKLQRQRHTFQEAFESFKQGKEIESCSGTIYRLNKATEEVHIIETQYENRTTIYCFGDVLFRCDEIQGKWYIND
ncbi:MAG: hypothetical protein E7H33_09835 [Clostridium perfringens]|nr:hypothetical protein [Clostridium perfringens]